MNSVWVRLPGCFLKGFQKQEFLDIYLTTVFRVRNFENTSAMEVIVFLKIFKILSRFQKCQKKKNWDKVFPFRDNYISIGYVKLSLLRRRYFWSAVNVLKNSPEILLIIKIRFFELNFLHSVQQIWYKRCHSDFSTVWSHLQCCLLKGPLERNVL